MKYLIFTTILIVSSCTISFASTHKALNQSDLSDLQIKLEQMVETRVETKKEEFKTSILSKIGSKFSYKGQAYFPVAKLGTGAEGTVLLYETNDIKLPKNLIVKNFNNEFLLQNNLANLEAAKNAGAEIMNVYALLGNKSFIAEYVPGLFLKDILEADLSAKQKEYIQNEYDKIKEKQPLLDILNWMLYIEKGQLKAKMIDPH